MAGLMDKVKQAAGGVADATKKGASVAAGATKKGAAAAQTKARLHSLRNKADEKAQQLGYLIARERGGGEPAGAEGDDLVSAIAELEREIEELKASAAGDTEDDDTEEAETSG